MKSRFIENNEEFAILEGDFGKIYFGKIYRFMDLYGIQETLKNSKLRFKRMDALNDPLEALFLEISVKSYMLGFKERKGRELTLILIEKLFQSIGTSKNLTKKFLIKLKEENNQQKFNLLIGQVIEYVFHHGKQEFSLMLCEILPDLRKMFKVCCFSTEYNLENSELMWKRYADKGEGACLEFDLGQYYKDQFDEKNDSGFKIEYLPHKIIYCKDIPVVLFENDKHAFQLLKYKRDLYSYEKEVRMILEDDQEQEFKDVAFPFQYLSKIIFGLNTPTEEKEKIKYLIEKNENIGDIIFEDVSL